MHLPASPLRVAMAISLSSMAWPVAAAHLEIQGGRSYMDSYATNAVFVEDVFDEHRIGGSGFSWSPDVSLGWLEGRAIARYDGSRYTTRDQVWVLAGGARFHYGKTSDWYRSLFFSFQPAVQTGRTQALSTPYEFVSTLGWQGRHFSVQVRHISNGNLHHPNRGETMALVGVAFDP